MRVKLLNLESKTNSKLDYMDYILEKSCGRLLYLVLLFESLDSIKTSNIYPRKDIFIYLVRY